MRAKSVSVWIDFRNAIFRRGLRAHLRDNRFAVAGESAALVPQPDLAQTTILLFELEGSGVQQVVNLVAGSSIHVVGMVNDATEEVLVDAITAGFAGLLTTKELTPEKLVGALSAVATGNESLSAEILGRILQTQRDPGRESTGEGTDLAPREIEVLRLLAEGGSTNDIAERLRYSERTVKNIVHDALTKMNCRTRAHATALATRMGVI